MNVFLKFSLAREVEMKEGRVMVDKPRTIFLPTNFMGLYSLKVKGDQGDLRTLYESIKNGMRKTTRSVGKEYMLSYRDFLDRWVKYCAFGGWGIVSYQLIEKEGGEKGSLPLRICHSTYTSKTMGSETLRMSSFKP